MPILIPGIKVSNNIMWEIKCKENISQSILYVTVHNKTNHIQFCTVTAFRHSWLLFAFVERSVWLSFCEQLQYLCNCNWSCHDWLCSYTAEIDKPYLCKYDVLEAIKQIVLLSTADLGVFLLISPRLLRLETSNLLEHQFKDCGWQWSP